MVITNVNQVVYRGDGVTTAFPFTFRIIDATDIKLLLIDADGTETDIQSDYFVDTVNNTVHYPGYAPGAEPPEADQPAPVQTGQKLVIYRELPITQEKNLGDKWPFFAIELGLDKLTLILQQIYGWWGRTLKFGVGWQIDHPDFDTTIPVEAGKTWRVNDEGTGFVATGDPDEAVVVANNAKDIAAGAKTTAEGIAATAQDAKDIAQDAKTVADDAKDVAAEAKTTAEGIAATAQDAKDIAQDAKDVAAEAKTTASGNLALSGGTLTGVVNGVTPPNGDNSKKLATTEFVTAKAGNYLPLSGGILTGDVLGVTPPNGDNSKKIANTEFIQALAGVLVPIGVVQAYAGNTVPDGWLLCDGSAISRTDYAELYSVIGDTYGSGDGSTTFNLPNLTDKFIQGNATSGTEHSAGLPNITGGGQVTAWKDISYSGAFVSTKKGSTANTGYASENNYFDIDFDASRSSAIYGNSNTVQPPSVTMRYIIKY